MSDTMTVSGPLREPFTTIEECIPDLERLQTAFDDEMIEIYDEKTDTFSREPVALLAFANELMRVLTHATGTQKILDAAATEGLYRDLAMGATHYRIMLETLLGLQFGKIPVVKTESAKGPFIDEISARVAKATSEQVE